MAAKRYLAKTGFNYGSNDKRVEAGEVVTDLPDGVVNQLLKADAIEEAPDLRSKEGREARDEALADTNVTEATVIEGDSKRKSAPAKKGAKR